MKTGELIEAIYGAAVALGVDSDLAASWAGYCGGEYEYLL